MNPRMDQGSWPVQCELEYKRKVLIKIDNRYTVKHLTQNNVMFLDNLSQSLSE